MLQAMLVKVVIKQVMKAVEKMSDKQLASDHEKRIKALEKNSHPKKKLVCDCCCKNKKKEK